jgi:hypothetical protein
LSVAKPFIVTADSRPSGGAENVSWNFEPAPWQLGLGF